MKTSLKDIAADMKPGRAEPAPAKVIDPKNYRTAETRADTRQVSGHFPAEDVKAFKRMALEADMDVQEMMAEAFNMAFERYGLPNRMEIVSGRRKRA
ncbi:ribbon-helix-helix domain-containing protein [Novosphingobium sp. FKTRR1]|uniref:ribbon-helix-helix domain-containing protein n=1 Tax=Novosphingobium sp. FKTRR1 TaxID=2879118 RepID=UPI001CF0494C|nr:ribbon-helix-helix domain-containing protein [Novosphingobium sp. FKTRR1]